MNRRLFLSSLGALGLTPALLHPRPRLFTDAAVLHPADLPSGIEDRLRSLVEASLSRGASYADARLLLTREQTVSVQQQEVYAVSDTEQAGVGLRVYKNGAWGYCAVNLTSLRDPAVAAASACEMADLLSPVHPLPFSKEGRLANHRESYSTPLERDPFSVPLAEKRDFLLSLTERALKHAVVVYSVANLFAVSRRTLMVTSQDAVLDTTHIWTWPNFAVTAFKRGVVDNRASTVEPRATGYEITTRHPFSEEVEQAVYEVEQQQMAAILPSGGTFDLLVEPTHGWRVLYDTLLPQLHPATLTGHDGSRPSDRLFSPAQIGAAPILSTQFTLQSCADQPQGLSSGGWDDGGRVPPTSPIFQNGSLVGIPIGDEQESQLPGPALRCQRQVDWKFPPTAGMPDLTLMGADPGPSRADLISSIDRGFLIAGRMPTQLSPNLRRFKSAGQRAWYIEKGKIKDMVRDIEYETGVEEFWKNLVAVGSNADAVSGADMTGGATSLWTHPFSVRVPYTVFKDISVFSLREEKK